MKLRRIKKELKKRKAIIIVCICFIILTICLTYPLISNLECFLLTNDFKDISHSDTIQHIDHAKEAKKLLLEGNDPIITDATDVAQTYIFFSFILTTIFGTSHPFAHNFYFLICLFLSGLFMYMLMKELCNDELASFFAGLLYMSSNYIFIEYIWGHTNIMQIQWIPLIFLLFEKMLKSDKIRYPIFFSITLMLQLVSSSQYTIYLTFILPMYAIIRISLLDKKIFWRKESWRKINISLIASILLSSYYLMKRIDIDYHIRSIEDNLTPGWRLTSINDFSLIYTTGYSALFFISLFIIGAVIIILSIKDHEYKKYTAHIIIAAFVGVCLFGPFAAYAPYTLLYKYWPLVKYFRVPARMAPFFLMSTAIISSISILSLKKKIPGTYRIILAIAIIMITALLLITHSQYASLSSHHLYCLAQI